jgi:hypothetical protein
LACLVGNIVPLASAFMVGFKFFDHANIGWSSQFNGGSLLFRGGLYGFDTIDFGCTPLLFALINNDA